MEITTTFSVRPIGIMKSVFHFKNGTPRQPSLCRTAKGVLQIDKSVFNNPEHSLDGLHEFTYAWIIFLFHKNDNTSFNKAKVKPPRLNGRRVGVFSTRSPYRPNNIGLSLAKIDEIDGANIHFSGIDILDGTPVLDIKPYIPEYDTPVISAGLRVNDDRSQLYRDTRDSGFLESKVSYTRSSDANESDNVKFDRQNSETCSCSLSSSFTDSSSLNSVISDNKQFSQHFDNEHGLEKTRANSGRSESVSQGFYALSAALNKAGSEICSKSNQTDFPMENLNPRAQHKISLNCASLEDTSQYLEDSETSQTNSISDHFLDFLVGNAISKAASDLGQSECTKKLFHSEERDNFSEENETFSVNESIDNPLKFEFDQSKVNHGKLGYQGEKNEQSTHLECKSAVTALWLSSPPVSKLRISFTPDALKQLGEFSRNSSDEKYRLQMFSDSEDAKAAISSILHEEPRSIYRRQQCQDKLYFFVLDVLHVTSWFDEDSAQVVRIKPVKDVPFVEKR